MNGIILQVSYLSIVLVCLVDCSKYDVNTESLKLFGEDLNGVLKRFKRSSDYLKIMNEVKLNLNQEIMDIYTHLMAYYEPKIKKHIKDILGIKDEDEKEKPDTKEGEKKKRFRHLRDNDEEPTDEELLDAYVIVLRELTVPEINSFINLGFEYAGKIIHSLISSFSASEEDAKFTKGTGSQAVTHDHKVTNEEASSVAPTVKKPTPAAVDDDASYRANKKKLNAQELTEDD